MIGTTTGDGAAVPAAFLLAGARLVGDRAVVPDDVADEATALLTVLDELVRAQLDSPGAPGPARAPDAVAARRLEGGWRVLGPRGVPGSHRRDLELVLVGPAGVFVGVGVGWVNLRAAGGHLWRGPECADVVLDAVSADADAVRRLLAETGLAPAEVVPLVLATGTDPAPSVVRGVTVVGMARLASALVRRGARLEPPAVAALADVLTRTCPARPRADHHADPDRCVLAPLRATENDRVMRALDEALSTAPAPAWASWLHPEQARAVVRPLAGPALLGGPSGTGKTVAALQRARAAAASGRRVLVTSPAQGVVDAARAQARRIGGQGWDGVDLLGLPSVARRLLADRADASAEGIGGTDADLAACWDQAWAECGPPPSAAATLPAAPFWREEVAEVLGRGLDGEGDHADWCDSRPVLLPEVIRARVWELAEAYRHALRTRRLLDTEELYRRASARLAVAHRPPWDTVIVDGAQDCSWAALQLVVALGGTRAEGLLLVADPDQACPRSPATLGEAGVDLGDRVLPLRQDHRGAEAVLAAARDLAGGEPRARAVATAHPRRSGGRSAMVEVGSEAAEEAAVVAALAAERARAAATTDQLLVVDGLAGVARWTRVLTAAGVPVGIAARTGRPDGAVRVVTVEDARGLEAAQVFVTAAVTDIGTAGSGQGRASGAVGPALAASLARARARRLRLAAGRARDLLWVAVRGPAAAG